MRLRSTIAALAILLSPLAAGAAEPLSIEAMPVGITLQPLGTPQGYGAQRLSFSPRNEIVYSNDKGLTLYTFDKDAGGKSTCTDECAKEWVPLAPLPGAKPIANWTIITHPDGVKQWAHHGKPLYTYVKDKEGGDVYGLGADPALDYKGSVGGNPGKALTAKLPEGWHRENFQTGGKPTIDIRTPLGFGVREVTDANGLVLVNAEGQVLYTYDGDLEKDKRACGTASAICAGFNPVVAPLMARAAGDWTVIGRRDGIKQWHYKNRPLYTYEADRIPGDVHGENVDKRWRLAVVATYWLPANIKFRDDPGRGRQLVSSNGMTLYRRDIKAFNPASAQLAHDRPYRPRVGRMIRDVACDERCRTEWIPYLAPNNAQPRGYWGVHTLADGRKQWTYKDFALYTFVGDKVPGDMTGDAIYDNIMSDDPTVDNSNIGFPALYRAGFFWTFATL